MHYLYQFNYTVFLFFRQQICLIFGTNYINCTPFAKFVYPLYHINVSFCKFMLSFVLIFANQKGRRPTWGKRPFCISRSDNKLIVLSYLKDQSILHSNYTDMSIITCVNQNFVIRLKHYRCCTHRIAFYLAVFHNNNALCKCIKRDSAYLGSRHIK